MLAESNKTFRRCTWLLWYCGPRTRGGSRPRGIRTLGGSGDGSTVDDTVLSGTNTRGVGMPQGGIRAEVTRGRDRRGRGRGRGVRGQGRGQGRSRCRGQGRGRGRGESGSTSLSLQTSDHNRISARSTTFIRPSDRRGIIEPLERSLIMKKRRTYAPASYMLAQSTQEAIPVVSSFEPQPSTSAAAFAMDVPESAPQPASPAIFVPSPAAFVELEGHGNITSPSSIASPSISFRTSRPLNDDEIEEALMFNGSDDDCDEDDNDEIRVPMMLPPYMRLQAEEHTLEEAEDELSPLPPSLPPRIWVDVGAEPSTRSQSEARLVSMVSVGCQTDSPIGPTTAFDMQWNSFLHTRFKFTGTIWDHTLVEKIVKETNAFASRLLARMTAQGLMRPNSRMSRWKDTTVDEMYVFLAIILTMGILVKSRIEDYWSTSKDIFSTPGVAENMSINRFKLLSRCIHFNDDSLMPPNTRGAPARLFKVQPLISYLNLKFSSLYDLSRNISLDESLVQWRGWLCFKQFIKNKAAAVGIKTYEVCESDTGYLWRFEVHADKLPAEPKVEAEVAGAIPTLVLRLLNGLEYRGHTVWMDNFYNSPALARTLKSKVSIAWELYEQIVCWFLRN
ncbi:PiggyBac transposable element-derived protein 4 [Eumeta japonica]|uniref:PiggyBac transposable element-derived protein 4 n=1 Tax=Eumeta variegata TaxID=151549 RepID=A0A4C1VJP2_EUMVA|nr:PiggyBac transposable element-derived protein 4 [Eumeta japonica]